MISADKLRKTLVEAENELIEAQSQKQEIELVIRYLEKKIKESEEIEIYGRSRLPEER